MINILRKKKKLIIIVISSIVVLGIIFWAVDRSRVFAGKTPLFAINIGVNKDTKAELYYGLGYVAVRCVDPYSSAEYTNIHIIFSKKINHVCFSGEPY